MFSTLKFIVISTIATIDSFWRCKTQFTKTPREIAVDDLGASDLDRLLDEPNLVVVDPETGKVISRGREGKAPPPAFAKAAAAAEEPVAELSDYFLANEVEMQVLFESRKKQLSKIKSRQSIKIKSEPKLFADSRPTWASRGDVWVTTIEPETDDPWTVCITDTKRAADAWLKDNTAE